jgi:IclR family mhp operon transcriptional activator
MQAQRQGTLRTLQILTALSGKPDSTVTALRAQTGISRPAIYRILEILLELGYAARRPESGTYSLTSKIRLLTDNFRDEDQIAEAARPILAALQRQVTWPTDLTRYDDGAMVCVETTRAKSPLVLERDGIGSRIPMLRSAVGLAYLAFSAAETRELVLRTLRTSGSPDDLAAHQPELLEAMLDATRRRGYGVRPHDYRPKTCSIAVPIASDGRVLGCLAIEFMRSALTPEEAAERYLAQIRSAAEELRGRWVEDRLEPGALRRAG